MICVYIYISLIWSLGVFLPALSAFGALIVLASGARAGWELPGVGALAADKVLSMDSVAVHRDNPLVERRHVVLRLAGHRHGMLAPNCSPNISLLFMVELFTERHVVKLRAEHVLPNIYVGLLYGWSISWVESRLHVDFDVAIVLWLHPVPLGLKVREFAQGNVCEVDVSNVMAAKILWSVAAVNDDLLYLLVLVIIVKLELEAEWDGNWSNCRHVILVSILHSLTRKVDIRTIGLLKVIPVLGAGIALALCIFVESHSALFEGIDFCEVETACINLRNIQVLVLVYARAILSETVALLVTSRIFPAIRIIHIIFFIMLESDITAAYHWVDFRFCIKSGNFVIFERINALCNGVASVASLFIKIAAIFFWSDVECACNAKHKGDCTRFDLLRFHHNF